MYINNYKLHTYKGLLHFCVLFPLNAVFLPLLAEWVAILIIGDSMFSIEGMQEGRRRDPGGEGRGDRGTRPA